MKITIKEDMPFDTLYFNFDNKKSLIDFLQEKYIKYYNIELEDIDGDFFSNLIKILEKINLKMWEGFLTIII